MTTQLFRPVGLGELALIWDKEMREFPPRLPGQPIFYPVANRDYARQIARDWNTRDEKSGFSGFVTTFEIDSKHLSNFEPHRVGSSSHVEYWIPAAALSSTNAAISGRIHLAEGFFGTNFVGHIPDSFGLRGKDAIDQFIALSKWWEYSRFDVACETSTNRKSIFLNWLFWIQHDFSSLGISEQDKANLLGNLKECWKFNRIEISLPTG